MSGSVPEFCAGLDVSHHQRPHLFDFPKVRERFRFGIARATWGTKVDATFATFFTAFRNHGFVPGAYHFYRPSKTVPEQLKAFRGQLQVAGFRPGCLYPAVDIEPDSADGAFTLERYAPAFDLVRALRTLYGGVIVYTSPLALALLGSYDTLTEPGVYLWIAHHGVLEPDTPPGLEWAMWQTKVAPSIPGYQTKIDLNLAKLPLPIIPEIDRKGIMNLVGVGLLNLKNRHFDKIEKDISDEKTPVQVPNPGNRGGP